MYNPGPVGLNKYGISPQKMSRLNSRPTKHPNLVRGEGVDNIDVLAVVFVLGQRVKNLNFLDLRVVVRMVRRMICRSFLRVHSRQPLVHAIVDCNIARRKSLKDCGQNSPLILQLPFHEEPSQGRRRSQSQLSLLYRGNNLVYSSRRRYKER